MIIKQKLYVRDEKDRYFHIYHNPHKEASERDDVEEKIERIRKYLGSVPGNHMKQGKWCNSTSACIIPRTVCW